MGIYCPSVAYNVLFILSGLMSNKVHACALILHVSGGTYGLTSTPNDRFFEKPFHSKFNYAHFVLLPVLGYKPGLYV